MDSKGTDVMVAHACNQGSVLLATIKLFVSGPIQGEKPHLCTSGPRSYNHSAFLVL